MRKINSMMGRLNGGRWVTNVLALHEPDLLHKNFLIPTANLITQPRNKNVNNRRRESALLFQKFRQYTCACIGSTKWDDRGLAAPDTFLLLAHSRTVALEWWSNLLCRLPCLSKVCMDNQFYVGLGFWMLNVAAHCAFMPVCFKML